MGGDPDAQTSIALGRVQFSPGGILFIAGFSSTSTSILNFQYNFTSTKEYYMKEKTHSLYKLQFKFYKQDRLNLFPIKFELSGQDLDLLLLSYLPA